MKIERNMIGGVAAALIVVAAVSFWAGTKFAASTPAQGAGFARGQGVGGQPGTQRFGGGGAVSGTVTAKDAQSITIQMRQGGSRIVFFGAKTEVGKMIAGTPGDVSVGANVTAVGTQNSDGSVSANSIQIRPAGMAGPGTGAGSPRAQQ